MNENEVAGSLLTTIIVILSMAIWAAALVVAYIADDRMCQPRMKKYAAEQALLASQSGYESRIDV